MAAYPAAVFAGKLEGLIASPPCPDWSKAGKRATVNGATGALVAEVIRWAVEARPTWIAAEQVDTVLPLWRAFAGELRRLGYRCWCGLLDAADYGVPQNRVRAFLLAHAGGQPQPPAPTHAERPAVDLAGGTLEPWVSMAAALGLDALAEVDRRADAPPRAASGPAPTVTAAAGGESQWVLRTNHRTGSEPGVRYERPLGRPAPTVDGEAVKWRVQTGSRSKVSRRSGGVYEAFHKEADRPAPAVIANVDRWRLRHSGHSQGRGRPQLTRGLDRPAPTIHFGHDEASWAWFRPATAEEVVHLTLADALVLQGFDPDLPVAGATKRERHLQVGNAVPPAMAAAVLAAVMAAGPPDSRPAPAPGPWTDYLPNLAAFVVPTRPQAAPARSLWDPADGCPAGQDGAA